MSQPDLIRQVVRKHFVPVQQSVGWGEWRFVGKPAYGCGLYLEPTQ